MKQIKLVAIAFIAVLVAPKSATGQENAIESESDELVATEIELDRLVHFLDPTGKAIPVAAGQYRVKRSDASASTLVAVDGRSNSIAAEASEHDEELGFPPTVQSATDPRGT